MIRPIRFTRAVLTSVLALSATLLPIKFAATSLSVTGHATAATCASLGAVTALANGPAGTLLIGTRGGLYRAASGGRCPTAIAAFPTGIDVGTIVVPPGQPNTLVAGASFLITTNASSFRLYRSTDGGQTWDDGTHGLPRTPIVPLHIAVSPRGTLIMSYVCPADEKYISGTLLCRGALARSTDGGGSWQPVGPKAATETARGVVALGNGSLLALQQPVVRQRLLPGVAYRSDDDGRTWRAISSLALRQGAADDALNRLGDAGILFAVPWEQSVALLGTGLQTFQAQAYRSLDGGAHWSVAWSPHGQSYGVVVAFAALPRHRTLLLSDIQTVYRSTDGGTTWQPSGAGLPLPTDNASPRIWTLLAAADGKTVYAGSDKGLFHSDDDGGAWRLAAP